MERMDRFEIVKHSLLIAAAGLLGACSGGGSDGGAPGASTLSVSLTDAPVDGVAEVKVKIDAIWLKAPGSAAKQLTLASGPTTVNLLTLTPDNAALLIKDAQVEPGSYEWLAMDVSAEIDSVYDSYVMTTAGGQEELRVPSGRVRLVDGFDVPANQAVKLVFDWDLRKGLVHPPGQGGYLLKPAFRVLGVTAYGSLKGTVAPETLTATGDPNGCAADGADLNVGNIVYVFAGNGVVPDDIDGVAPDPVATADVEQNAAGQYAYRLLLEPGDYTVAFTCQGGNDDPEVDETGTPKQLKFVAPVNRTITGAEATADF
jgi:hypothetical protein